MDAEQRQVAADLWTKPTDLSHRPACRHLRHYIHHRHLLLLSPKADTHVFLALMLSALYAVARPSDCHMGGSVKNG